VVTDVAKWFSPTLLGLFTSKSTLWQRTDHWWLLTQGDDYGRFGWFSTNCIKIGGPG